MEDLSILDNQRFKFTFVNKFYRRPFGSLIDPVELKCKEFPPLGLNILRIGAVMEYPVFEGQQGTDRITSTVNSRAEVIIQLGDCYCHACSDSCVYSAASGGVKMNCFSTLTRSGQNCSTIDFLHHPND